MNDFGAEIYMEVNPSDTVSTIIGDGRYHTDLNVKDAEKRAYSVPVLLPRRQGNARATPASAWYQRECVMFYA
eukprot:m.450813 g.450813  ORF g.450813 m.450813 type:complete len:73 (-) comp20322_c0_seq19:356-574(-)